MTIAFTFPGQGSQAVGMGRALAEAYPEARAVFDEVDSALGEKLSAIIFEGPIETLTLTENAQPALMAVSLAATRVLAAKGVGIDRVAYVAGHSLGEYSALAAAGSLSSRTRRGFSASAAGPCRRRCRSALGRWRRSSASTSTPQPRSPPRRRRVQVCAAANDNGAGQVVVSGNKAAVERAVELAKARGARRAMLLPVSAPFHCALMAPAAKVMAEALKDVTINPPACPLVANVTAAPVNRPGGDPPQPRSSR